MERWIVVRETLAGTEFYGFFTRASKASGWALNEFGINPASGRRWWVRKVEMPR